MADDTHRLKYDSYYLTAILLVAALRFLNLGFLDLQAWDEALYAVRSVGIIQFGGIIDQTSYSIGGLYSSLHPPLYVWLTSFSLLVFGVTEFAVRFFSAIFGGLTLYLIYSTGKDLHSPKVGFVAAMLFGLNPFVSFFARQGQFDTTLVFFLTLSILLLLRFEKRGGLRLAFFAGLAVGASLMAKLFVGCGIPLSYFFWKVATNEEGKSIWKPLAAIVLGAMLVSGPWYVYMTITRGHSNPLFFLDASAIVERSISGVEGNIKPLEVLYYFNQLIVLFPLGIIWFFAGMYHVFKRGERHWLLPATWFVVFFAVFTLMRTKLAVYLLPMLVPSALIAAYTLVVLAPSAMPKKFVALLLASTGAAFIWASDQGLRNATKSILSGVFTAHLPLRSDLLASIPLALIFCCVLFICYALCRRDDFLRITSPLAAIILLPSFVTCLYSIAAVDQFEYKDGAHDLVRFIADRHPSFLLVAGFDRNPQLTFYLDGADIGWSDELEVKRVSPPTERSQLRAWLTQQTRNLPGNSLVIAEKDKFIRYERVSVQELNPPDFSLVFESRRYAVFQRTPSTELAEVTR
jgi:4-amino-4-deoxy-L-arabinose transferase-like glycosyltransferase